MKAPILTLCLASALTTLFSTLPQAEGVVVWPKDRREPWLYGHVIGNFGPQNSTYNITAIPYIVTDDLCSETATYPEMENKVVLVKRGNCSFIQKVSNAEKNKALAVLVGNTTDEYVTIRVVKTTTACIYAS